MERLTEIKTHVTGFSYTDKKEGIFAQNVYAKLAAYEDTGLTPAQVEAMKMDMEQLRADNINAEMNLAHMTADKDERAGCEVCNKGLPCENGCDGFCDICDIPEVWKTIHKTGQYNYCPICGKKLGTAPICNTTKLPCAGCNPVCEHRAKS